MFFFSSEGYAIVFAKEDFASNEVVVYLECSNVEVVFGIGGFFSVFCYLSWAEAVDGLLMSCLCPFWAATGGSMKDCNQESMLF